MRKSILLSVMAIAAAVAIAAGASTFATFTDTSTVSSNTLVAGNIHLAVNGDQDGTVAIAFTNGSPASCVAFNNMAFGDTCDISYTATNNGTLSVNLSKVDTASRSVPGCYAFTHTLPSTSVADDDINPGASVTGSISVTLSRSAPATADNDCQDATFSISTVITATQSATPHD